jgi:hypothetical protein
MPVTVGGVCQASVQVCWVVAPSTAQPSQCSPGGFVPRSVGRAARGWSKFVLGASGITSPARAPPSSTRPLLPPG